MAMSSFKDWIYGEALDREQPAGVVPGKTGDNADMGIRSKSSTDQMPAVKEPEIKPDEMFKPKYLSRAFKPNKKYFSDKKGQ